MYYILIDEVQYAIAKEELKNPEGIRFLSENIILLSAEINLKRMKNMLCTGVCLWFYPERTVQTRWPIY